MAMAGEKGAALVELKAVDGAYPGGRRARRPIRSRRSRDLLARARRRLRRRRPIPALLARLDLKVGDRDHASAGAPSSCARSLVSEPDKIASGIGFGPRLHDLAGGPAGHRPAPARQPRALDLPRCILPPGASDDAALDAARARRPARPLPEAGWEIRSRANADPRFASATSSASPSS